MNKYALSFEPHGGGTIVPADAFVATLESVLEGLAYARNAAAPLIAQRRSWPVADVKKSLELGVAPIERGSLVVPFVVGVGAEAHLDDERVSAMYWRLTGTMLAGAANGNARAAELSAAGAEAFAKGARCASEARCSLRLVRRTRPNATGWSTIGNLTTLEKPLRGYAERRQTVSTTRAQIIGQLVGLSFDPPSFTLLTPTGRRAVRLPAHLRDDARARWGEEVVVDVEANVTIEGDVRDPKAVALRTVPNANGTAFASTFGAAKDTWGTDEARAYVQELRGGRERN
jgi:hypothetical protein